MRIRLSNDQVTVRLRAFAVCICAMALGLVATSVSPTAASVEDASSVEEILGQPDYNGESHAEILRLYQAIFGRAPDLDGAKYWIRVNNGAEDGVAHSVLAIAGFMSISPEWASNYEGTDDEVFLERVYSNVLGRDYDQAGFNYWLDTLRGTNTTGENPNGTILDRPSMVFYVTANPEFISQYEFAPTAPSDPEPDPDPATELPAADGPLSAPHPTIENVTLLWDTVGDTNGNANVTVRYRQSGTFTWLPALPLQRVPAGSNEGFTWTSRHAGSIFNLSPGTQYEVEATLTDPDGPNDVRSISVRTRSVPTAMANAPIRSATPETLNSVLSSAQPGDIVLLSAGTYSEFEINRSGAPGRPIVVRGLPGAVVTRELNIFDQSDVHVEDLTINGRIRFNGSDRIAITGNTINASADRNGDGIVTFTRSEDSYIADNTINGLTVWREPSFGAQGDNLGEGILVTGPGHVIEHNRVTGMRDGISFMEDNSVDQFSIDVLRNDISEAGDDGIEADFCMHNCRIVENQLTNTFIAFSSQPSLGGPTYFVRNAAYNVGHVAFKLYRGSQGDVLLHNTVVKGGDALGIYAGRNVSELYMRNNLMIGGPGDTYNGFSSGSGQVIRAVDIDESTADMNYNGYGSTTGEFTGRLGDTTFSNMAEMRARTTETNSVQLALNTFAAAIAYPNDARSQFGPVDLRLASTSLAVNAGVSLPTINDSAVGAPDLGAFERGSAPPAYGPRG